MLFPNIYLHIVIIRGHIPVANIYLLRSAISNPRGARSPLSGGIRRKGEGKGRRKDGFAFFRGAGRGGIAPKENFDYK